MASAPPTFSPLRAFVLGSLGVLGITLVLLPLGGDLTRAAPALLLLIPVVVAGVLGGRLAGAGVALEASAAFLVGFLPPVGVPTVRVADDLVELVLFIVIAGAAGILIADVVTNQRRQVEADQARIDALELADGQRGALLRSVSHDLRTPLATIRAVATDLSSDAPFDPDVRRELLDLVVDEAERLDRIVGNLLSMSRIEAGSFLPDRQAVDVDELIEACCGRLGRVLQNVRLEMDIEPDIPLIDLDYSQFDQVVSNLVENAARHSPPGGLVRVVARAGPPLTVQVIDEGEGLAPGMAERIFEPFTVASSATSTSGPTTGGTTTASTTTGSSTTSGVGLAICKAIVEAHDGTIVASDGAGRGACFTITVPARG